MRGVLVLVVMVISLTAVASMFMLIQPVFKMGSTLMNSTVFENVDGSTPQSASNRVYSIMNLTYRIAGAVIIMAFLVWAFISAQRKDYESMRVYE